MRESTLGERADEKQTRPGLNPHPLTASPVPSLNSLLMKRPEVTIYTDGACSGNPGPGGYGAVLLFGEHRKEISEGFRRTTNNRMELLAVIEALRSLKKNCSVTIHSDSKYVIDAIEKKWIVGWQRRGWIKRDGGPVLNRDLWEDLLKLLAMHQVRFVWVRGHSGVRENERCDALAVAASRRSRLIDDTGMKAG